MNLGTSRLSVMMLVVVVLFVSCHSTSKLVVDPSGWEVVSFDCEYAGSEGSELLHINESGFEHVREGVVRGRRTRVNMKGDQHKATTQVLWISSSGKEQTVSDLPMDREKTQRLLQDYKTKYFIYSKFPSETDVRSRISVRKGVREVVSFCGRKAYRLTSGQVTEIIDARTGIRLARYNGGVQVQRLVYARWRLKKGAEWGYYEVRCNQD